MKRFIGIAVSVSLILSMLCGCSSQNDTQSNVSDEVIIEQVVSDTTSETSSNEDIVSNDIISENQPDAQIKMHQTWSLCNEKATEKRPNFAVPWESSTAMFNQIESCYNRAAEKVGLTENDIIKSGKAIQLAKDKYGYGDIYNTKENGKLTVAETLANNALYADNLSHLNHRGRYLASLVFVESLLGIDSREVTFVPEVLDEADCKLLRRIAHEAVTGEVSYEQGDINGDGTVNASDLAFLKKVVAGFVDVDSEEVKNANVDESLGAPNAADLALLKKMLAGLV